jgi:hypothetical protein
VFVLNPAAYQMESRGGTGLLQERVKQLWPHTDAEKLLRELTTSNPPRGGDYMRMWIRVLVEDGRYPDNDSEGPSKRGRNCGGMFDGVYFLGPSDVHVFFGAGSGTSLTQAVESYFARKYATDLDFRLEFEGGSDQTWESRRKRFIRYYALRASASFSLGSHDEWNAMVRLNRKRREDVNVYGPGEELACYFDGRQMSPAAADTFVHPGYEITEDRTAVEGTSSPVWPRASSPDAATSRSKPNP